MSSGKRNAPSNANPLAAWFNQQAAAIKFSMERLWFHPLSTWITLLTIAIALALPLGMHLLLKNLKTLTDDKREIPTITVYFKQQVSEQQARDRADLISELREVQSVQVLTREQAWQEMLKAEGGQGIETLEENPFPHALVITPKLQLLPNLEADMREFVRKLKTYPDIEDAQLDLEWIMRLRAILRIVDTVVLIVSALLGLAVIFVVGNTIRLDIENRKEEIRVTRLLGATNGYVRRVFLYNGFWLGLFGGVISLVLVHVALLFLLPPINQLAELYGSQYTLRGVDLTMTLQMLAISSLLGIIGSWLVVSRYLWKDENGMA